MYIYAHSNNSRCHLWGIILSITCCLILTFIRLFYDLKVPDFVSFNLLPSLYFLKTGCTVDIKWNSTFYSNLATNEQLAKVYQSNAEDLGLTFPSREEQAKATFGSTDMGNVSHVKPSIHPYFDIETSVANHTLEFTEAAGKKQAHDRAVLQAKAMALTALDVLCSEQVWESVVNDFGKEHVK